MLAQRKALVIDPYYTSPYGNDANSPNSSSSYSFSPPTDMLSTESRSPSSAGTDWRICFVLAQHDFDSSDPDHLPFKQGELLEIVKKEQSGWWAAFREDRIGWIPSAFVTSISDEMADTLKDEVQTYEFNERANRSGSIAHSSDTSTPPDSAYGHQDDEEEWVTIVEPGGKMPFVQLMSPTGLVSARDYPDDVVPVQVAFTGPLSPPRSRSGSLDDFSTESESELSVKQLYRRSLLHQQQTRQYPPSPVTPMPVPTPVQTATPAPTPTSRNQNPVPKVAPALINKPVPPTPTPTHPSPASPARSPLLRSRSDSAPTTLASRSARRRPIILNDPPSLSRLTVYLDSNNPSEAEMSAPNLYRSYDSPESARSPTSRRPDKIKQLTGDDDAQAFHNAKLAQASLPWYLQPSYTSDDIKMEYDGGVRYGTLPALLERLTVDPLKLVQENRYRHAFLTTFPTFSKSDEVFELLIERYRMKPPAGLTPEEIDGWKEKKHRPVQKRVLTILSMWLEEHGMIQDDPHLAPRLREFLAAIHAPPSLALSAKLMTQSLDRLMSSPTVESPISSTASPSRKRSKSQRQKNDLLKMDPTELAQQLTTYEHKLYTKIRPKECISWAKSQKGEAVANLVAFCSTHDKLAAWVKLSILMNDGLGKRADTIDFWIKVAERCRSHNNFSSMSAVVAALSSTVITRLHLTWAHVGRASHIELLTRLTQPTGNFSTYRSLLSSVEGPCVPFIGMFLTDFVHVQDQLKDNVTYPLSSAASPGGLSCRSTEADSPRETSGIAASSPTGPPLINFIKRQKWYEAVNAILRFQNKTYGFAENTQTMVYVKEHLLLGIARDPAYFWTRSQELHQHELAHADIRRGLEAAGF